MDTNEMLRSLIPQAIALYKKTLGEAKWESLTEEEKDRVVHIMIMDCVRLMLNN